MTPPAEDVRLLVVDDEEDNLELIRELLTEELAGPGSLSFETETVFDRAEERLRAEHFDMVVLDVRDSGGSRLPQGHEARGRELYERIRKVRWVPVVFFTAVPQQVAGLEEPPLVRVVAKNRLEEFVTAVREGLASGVPTATRRITMLVDQVVRNYLRDQVSPLWNEFSRADQDEIVPVLMRRAAAELREESVRELDRGLDGSPGDTVDHPSAARVYLRPPVTTYTTSADVLRDPDDGWWVVLTPACDLYEDPEDAGTAKRTSKRRTAKAEFVRLAHATPLLESKPVREFREGRLKKDTLRNLFGERSNRYRVLPKFLDIPALLLDLENVTSRPLDEVRKWQRLATLDSPFAEALLTTHSRIVGRVGTPDIDFGPLLDELGLSKKRPSVPRPRGGSQAPAED